MALGLAYLIVYENRVNAFFFSSIRTRSIYPISSQVPFYYRPPVFFFLFLCWSQSLHIEAVLSGIGFPKVKVCVCVFLSFPPLATLAVREKKKRLSKS